MTSSLAAIQVICTLCAFIYCQSVDAVKMGKIIHMVFPPVCVQDDFRIGKNKKLYEVLNNMEVA